jgi:hypothetical protein
MSGTTQDGPAIGAQSILEVERLAKASQDVSFGTRNKDVAFIARTDGGKFETSGKLCESIAYPLAYHREVLDVQSLVLHAAHGKDPEFYIEAPNMNFAVPTLTIRSCHTDADGRVRWARLVLPAHNEFLWFHKLGTGAAEGSPKAIWTALRTALRDATPKTFLNALRRVNFSNQQQASLGIGAGQSNASISRDTLAKIGEQQDEFPEEVHFQIRVFESGVYTARFDSVAAATDADAAVGKVSVQPIRSQLENALIYHTSLIEAALREEIAANEKVAESPIYRGAPSPAEF